MVIEGTNPKLNHRMPKNIQRVMCISQVRKSITKNQQKILLERQMNLINSHRDLINSPINTLRTTKGKIWIGYPKMPPQSNWRNTSRRNMKTILGHHLPMSIQLVIMISRITLTTPLGRILLLNIIHLLIFPKEGIKIPVSLNSGLNSRMLYPKSKLSK